MTVNSSYATELSRELKENTKQISRNEVTERVKQRRIMSVDGIHFLFEAKQRIKVLDTLLDVYITLYQCSPFDCYVLGCVMSCSSCTWIASFHDVWNNIPLLVAKGTLEHDNQYSVEGCPVTLAMSGLSSQLNVDLNLSDLFSAHPVFLKRVLGLKLSRITRIRTRFSYHHLCDFNFWK